MVKEKSSNSRTFDDDGFRRRAACVCVRSEDESEVLLVSSSKHPDWWIIPGGGVEPDEKCGAETAVREVLEEAGVIGRLGRCLGVFENEEHKHRTEVYVLIVTQELEEWDDSKTIGRKRQWFSIEEALEKLEIHKPLQKNWIICMHSKNAVTT
ncbi:hypothetical protein PVAND_011049 [Polypedilum vanderplanki]|uniref:diphosphoinositol-polyphosphate diphosphatase n=1 Tax=Polypedilum vanderplanki TaxID=319348 RepID=A0A9J6CHG2_POLVA|nr:hypothetical protein PVAND_011049 [Polypedilum vanderplanki]